MFNIMGDSHRFCDGLTRRNFLQIGSLGFGGLSLPQILRAQSQQPTPWQSSHKATIMVFLPGGPPHQDMWEIKTQAPREIRGEFNPIATSVPGVQIGELFPRLAGMMEKLVAIRSLIGCRDEHSSHVCFSGYSRRDSKLHNRPSLGAFLSRIEGHVDQSVPPFVGLSPKMGHNPWSHPGESGFLGLTHTPFKPDGDGLANMVLNDITVDRLSDRKTLLSGLDRIRRDIDHSGTLNGVDAFTEKAFDVLTSSKLVDALDVEKEDPKIREMYGKGHQGNKDDGGPRTTSQFLIARRLVEAGVRCVTLAFSRWDWHGNNFGQARTEMPVLDQALSALITDLEMRGMLDDVSIVVWGDFGRTPRINSSAGRDHWSPVSCALLAGGGMNTGQAIGSTNRLGEVPKDRPVHYQEVFSTLYRQLGIDVEGMTVDDLQGRPQYLVDVRKPLPELI